MNGINMMLKSKKLLLSIFFIGTVVSLFYLIRFFSQFNIDLRDENFFHPSILLLILIVLLQMVGHYLRAYKSSLLINPIKNTNSLFLFKSLGIGFLFNSILPFRMGELMRAHVIGKKLNISRTVVFITILFERSIDVIIVLAGVAVALLVGGNVKVALNFISILLPFIIAMIAISLVILIVIFELYVQNKMLLKFFYKLTNLFNNKIKDKLRFIIWSVIYGINTIYQKVSIKKYVALSVLMWIFYVESLLLLAKVVFKNGDVAKNLLISLASYISASIPSGPAYVGTYHYYLTIIVSNIISQKENILSFSLISWVILVIPISIIGALFLFGNGLRQYGIFDFFSAKEIAGDASGKYMNKLFRYEDISNEMSYFLDAYFKNLEIARIISLQEISDKTRLLKTFKGGSNAVTILAWNGERECVRKITLLQHAAKLEDQYNWIKERQHLENIPNIIGCEKDEVSYSIDIEYNKEYIPFFDFIHSSNIDVSKKILEDVIIFVNKELYSSGEIIESVKNLDYYIKTKIFDKVNDCLVLNHQLPQIIDYPKIIINGKEYDNFSIIMEKITSNERIMQSISRYYQTSLHGDLTVDNIIVNEGKFILLDPNNENYISDPLVDYAKLYQSLHSGYEFLCMLESVRYNGNEIYFEENISSKYSELFLHLEKILSENLTHDRLKLIKFHEAIHYFRMLTYRAKINPETFLAFYSVAIRLLNEFYDDFIHEDII